MEEKNISEEPPRKNDEVGKSGYESERNIKTVLAITATAMVIGMALYELLRQIISPTTSTWESPVITVVLSSLLATIIVYFILRKQTSYLQNSSKQIAIHKQTQEALLRVHDNLQRQVEERNAELVEVNKQLRGEIEGRTELEDTITRQGESEEKYRIILESIEDGYFEVDIGGNFTFFNEALCRIAGLPRNELMGMNNREYTTPETAKKMYQVFNKVFLTGKPTKEFDWEIIRKNGTKRNVEASVALIKNSGGEPVGFRGIVRDVTERKETEEKIHKLLYSFGKTWTE
jgi:PAS domain S-box-containing protein